MFKQLMQAASCGLLALASAAAPARAYDFKIVHVFTGTGNDGSYPQGTPLLGRDGNVYGTTSSGGAHVCGTIYRLTPAGRVSSFHQFAGWRTGDGCLPKGGLVQDRKGNIYGSTAVEGGFGATGAGIVFKIAPDGTETVLHSFDQYDAHDGDGPFTGPVLDKAGNLWGGTPTGGKHDCPFTENQCGAVYRIKPNGTFDLIYSFKGLRDSGSPVGTMIGNDDGSVFGTAAYTSHYSYGTVFAISPDGRQSTVYAFRDKSKGGNPEAGLIRDGQGIFYGTTNTGGTNDLGAIFKMTIDGTETSLHSFTGADGSHPQRGNLARDRDGNLYGTTFDGGPALGGVVFQLTPGGVLNVLHAFDCNTGPCSPVGSVTLDGAGNLYGTTEYGDAAHGIGTIYELVK